MISNVFSFAASGALLFLCLFEWRRYHASRGEKGALAYPRDRLIRRLLTAFLSMAILLSLALKPDGLDLQTDLIWYGACLILALIVLFVAIRDLREAGRAAIDAHHEFQQQTAEQLEGLIDETRRNRRPGGGNP